MSSDDIKLSLDEVKANLPTIAEDVLGLYNLQFSFNEFYDILREFGGASSDFEISNVDYRPYLIAIKEIYIKFLVAQDAYINADAERFYDVNRDEILQLTFKQWSENKDRYEFDYDRDIVNIFNSILKVFDKYTYGIGLSDPENIYKISEDKIFKEILEIIDDPYKDELLEARAADRNETYTNKSEEDATEAHVYNQAYEDKSDLEEYYVDQSETEVQDEETEDGRHSFYKYDFDEYINSFDIISGK
ncbi:hypothetical protein [Fenollaria massiliensis]|uniref:Uncharacterized protein n=1 Tax=Fenollaria massiliensis TaxID=938288 RepID=A0A9E7ITR4_9FIRM|nr:hypothetical protein [Fenollaria massiliensis]UQK58687.1 hypothetical protein M1R53_05465 [Fenollaria massiliensis]